MKLTELQPKWIGLNGEHLWLGVRDGHGRAGWSGQNPHFGLTFLCPHCREQRIGVMFKPFIDPDDLVKLATWALPGAPNPNTGEVTEVLWWTRTGDTFDALSLTPSIDLSKYGHWHGYITNGELL